MLKLWFLGGISSYAQKAFPIEFLVQKIDFILNSLDLIAKIWISDNNIWSLHEFVSCWSKKASNFGPNEQSSPKRD